VDERRIDQLVRKLANHGTRRGLVGALVTLPLTRAFARWPDTETSAQADGGKTEEVYWELVHQLGRLGWVRIGPGALHDGTRMTWGFREGHATGTQPERLVWIPAHDELVAMHHVLRDLPRA
jgi:hypothetical protein